MKPVSSRQDVPIWFVVLLFATIVLPILLSAAPVHAAAVISTDKGDYSPGETAGISGSGFAANAAITIVVTGPDDSTNTLSATTDTSGDFTTSYLLDDTTGTYNVAATDESGNSASRRFTVTAATTSSTTAATQYEVVFAQDPSGAGSTIPSESALYDAGYVISISATPNSGYMFSGWGVSDALSITIAGASSPSTTATINGHGTITANFSPTTMKPAETKTVVSCNPTSVPVGTSTTCTATVTSSVPVTGQTVSWGSTGSGIFNSTSCALDGTCTVNYIPTAMGTGTHTITGNYVGDAAHLDSTGNFTLTVTAGTMTTTTTIVPTTPSGTATIWTDKPDYAPTDTPIIYGTGFLANANITITVTRPEGTVNTWYEPSDGSGGFTTTYVTSGLVFGTFTVTATDRRNTATTTFTDAAPSSITIIKNTGGLSGTFSFTSDLGNFNINAPNPGKNKFNSVGVGTHTVTETVPSGWDLTGLSCTPNGSGGGQGSADLANKKVTIYITSTDSQEVTCTFTDTKPATATLKVIKVVSNTHGGAAVAADFTLHVKASGVDVFGSPFSGSGSGTTFTLNAGTYVVSENSKTGYTSAITGACDSSGSIALVAGDSKTCTITNDDVAPTLRLVKTVVNDNGGTLQVSDFPLFIGTTSATNGTVYTLTANLEYTVSETSHAGYTASAWGGDCSAAGTITLQPGDVKTCRITNDDVQPLLTVTKVVVNDNGGTKAIADFPLFVGQTSVSSGVQAGFNAGTYTVSETSQTGYTSVISGDCASSGSITLAVGDVKACTITNDDVAPQLKIVKKTVGGDGAFNFTVKGPTLATKTITTSSGTGDTGFFAINAGTYNVTETVPLGWRLTTSSCSSGTPGSLTVSLGENVACTFTDQASFSVVTELKNNQFRLIYTPFSPGPFKMAASNPGQFHDNVVFFTGSATGTVTLTILVPYPFVTQGSQPIRVFDGYTPGDFTSHGADITSTFKIAGTPSKTPSNALAITLSDYGTSGFTEVYITLNGPVPASGIIYVDIHLDYGFKGSNGWSGDPKTTGTSPATCQTGGTCASLPGWGVGKKVPVTGTYTFGFTVGALHETQIVTSINALKQDPGIAGLITDVNKTPIPNAKVTISGPSVSATVYTDEDGWYQYVFKYTGKAATFTITASSTSWTQTKTVTLKSNGYIEVDFP